MDDLAAFITARLDEDEALASRAAKTPTANGPDAEWNPGLPFDVISEHIARHDPARVLREVAAKRAIAADHAAGHAPNIGPHKGRPCCRSCGALDDDPYLAEPWPCDTIRALAAMWSDHGDYRAEWAPGHG